MANKHLVSLQFPDLSDTYTIPTDAADIGAIAAPASPSAGDVLTYDSNDGWIAQAPSGGGSWTTVTDADLSEDVSYISVSDISAKEVALIFKGRVNDSSDSLANATETIAIEINGTKVQQGGYAYVRGAGTNILTLFRYEVVAGTTWGFANVYLNGSGQATFGGQGGEKAATEITSFKITTITTGHLFKSGSHVKIAYR